MSAGFGAGEKSPAAAVAVAADCPASVSFVRYPDAPARMASKFSGVRGRRDDFDAGSPRRGIRSPTWSGMVVDGAVADAVRRGHLVPVLPSSVTVVEAARSVNDRA